MDQGEEVDEVVDKARKIAPRVRPALEIGRCRGAGRIDERVVVLDSVS